MKKSKFDILNPDLQKEYLARGGSIEPDNCQLISLLENGPKRTYGKWTKKKKTKKKKKKAFKKKLSMYARQLNKNLPKSEVWFHNIWQEFRDQNDEYNSPFHFYIPDVINRTFRYVIEIDGSIHDLPEQIEKDKKKDKYYESMSYIVFRIDAYDEDSIESLMAEVSKIRDDLRNKKKNIKKKYVQRRRRCKNRAAVDV